MSSIAPILLLGLGGILGGGAWSVHKQGAPKLVVIALGVVALLAVAGGVLWMFPGGDA